MVVDVADLIADLRLELDRIEQSILILEILDCSNNAKWTGKRAGSPAGLARSRKPAPRVSSRTGKVISIARGTSRPESGARRMGESPEEDVSLSLRHLRSQTAKFQKAISTLAQKPAQ
jgi:hypothetical protein